MRRLLVLCTLGALACATTPERGTADVVTVKTENQIGRVRLENTAISFDMADPRTIRVYNQTNLPMAISIRNADDPNIVVYDDTWIPPGQPGDPVSNVFVSPRDRLYVDITRFASEPSNNPKEVDDEKTSANHPTMLSNKRYMIKFE